jgi:hypothetical protein
MTKQKEETIGDIKITNIQYIKQNKPTLFTMILHEI